MYMLKIHFILVITPDQNGKGKTSCVTNVHLWWKNSRPSGSEYAHSNGQCTTALRKPDCASGGPWSEAARPSIALVKLNG
ncbi:uncharacterized protein METZ01_LOCUS271837, partial [marine metagenome]